MVARSNDGIEGGRIAYLPDHAVTARTDIAIPGTPVSVRGGFYHASSRALVDGSAASLPAYTLADVGIGVDLAPVRIEAILGNVFDERYFTASGNAFAVYSGDLRTLSVRVAVGF